MKRALAGAVLALCPMVAYAADVSGVVVDDATGAPVAGAYVAQPGALNGVLTDAAGRFRLKLDPDHGQSVKITRDSYETLQVPAGPTMRVPLSPLTGFSPVKPAPALAYRSQPLDSLFHAAYQLNGFDASSGDARVSGLISNQLAVGGQYRLGNFMVKGEGMRNRIPVDVIGFPYKPTVSFDTWQARLGGGYVFNAGQMLDVYVGPEYLINWVHPDNRASGDAKPIPYTNTFLDRHPLRHALGANVAVGFRPFENLGLAVDGTYSPVVFSAVEPGMPELGGLQSWSIGARADYAIMIGVGLGVGWRHTGWFGGISDHQDTFSFGLSFNPWQVSL